MHNIKQKIKIIILFVFMTCMSGCVGNTKTEKFEWNMKSCTAGELEGIVQQIEVISDTEFYVTTANVTDCGFSQDLYYINLNEDKIDRIPIELDEDPRIVEIVNQGNGRFAALLSEDIENGKTGKEKLVSVDQIGKKLFEQEITDMIGDARIIGVSHSKDKFLVVTEECIYAFDENLNYVEAYEADCAIEDAVLGADEKMICVCADDQNPDHLKVRFRQLNLMKGIWENDLKSNFDKDESIRCLMKGRGNTFFLKGMKGIYECDEKGNTNLVLRYDELGFTNEEIECLAVLPTEGFIGCRIDESCMSSEIGLIHRERADEHKDMIVIGGVDIDSHALAKVQMYNKKNIGAQIEIKDYREQFGLSYVDACDRLYADILAGIGPDIIYLSGLDMNNLIRQKYLEKLDRYFENDTEVSMDDLIPSLRDAFSVDGSLYCLVSDFSISTMVGKSSMVGEKMGWEMEEVYRLWQQKQCAILPYDDNGIVFRCLVRGLVRDENTDIEDYRLALEMVNQVYSEDLEGYEDLKKGKVLMDQYGMTSPLDIQMVHAVLDDEEITLKGFPGVEGSGALFSIMSAWGISSKSEHKETAWKVIRLLMTKDYQMVSPESNPYFPSRLDCFEEYLQECTIEKNRNVWLIGQEWEYKGDKGVYTALSEEDVDLIKKMVYETRKEFGHYSTLEGIVNEEAGAYFSGDKDLDQVCELIKNRIELYLKEQ